MSSANTSLPLPHHKQHTLQGHRGAVNVARYTVDGAYCLTGGQDKEIRLWNPASGKFIQKYSAHGWEVYDLCSSYDNSRFASCGGDRTIFLWDVTAGEVSRRFSGHLQRVNCVGFNAEATVLFSGSYDATVRAWDLRAASRVPIQVLKDAKDSVASLVVSSHEVLTGSVDGKVRCYDLRMGQLSTDEIGHPVTSVQFTGDGNCLLVSTLDARIRLLDKENGGLLNEYTGHEHKEYRLRSCLAPMDTHVISGSEDGAIVFWDLLEGNEVRRLKGHHNVVSFVDAHPKEVGLLSASFDGNVIVWK
ncbi:nuclear mRNA splicing protein [Syncephalis pseudoplumigaleata]|uniref:Nuclear mRNA splicing protein n=1 Tax=Syncephalis pseudoplumigaleata TaxID=1712513 RepID=A0A4P9YXR1_9FUNG|nr:nuclear mRNA splicing protein [Syncephalis pseudoplumigaleata]|eukprot:RKP24322.1 nuclear mRNA splicing protein [Syncephalis pseudoplumigaleata]